jgi:hypothetical protein
LTSDAPGFELPSRQLAIVLNTGQCQESGCHMRKRNVMNRIMELVHLQKRSHPSPDPVILNEGLVRWARRDDHRKISCARGWCAELIILGFEPNTMSLQKAIQTIRSKSSASRMASLLVLAEPGHEDPARQLIGHGVNRVMLTVDSPKHIGLQVANLLDIPPRATLRLSTRMLVELEDGFEEALGAVVNISAKGLLLETDADIEPGQHVIMSIDVGPLREPIAAKAEIVRKASPEREGIEGIGAHFLSFAGDSQRQLANILGEAFTVPLDQLRAAT